MEKIKEYHEKAVITIKVTGVKKAAPERPQTALVKSAASRGGTTEAKPVARPTLAVQRNQLVRKHLQHRREVDSRNRAVQKVFCQLKENSPL
jgi:D-lyxose ketol-isomerase